MTVISDINSTLATMRGISSSFQELTVKTNDQEIQALFRQCMLDADEIANDLQIRVEKLNIEEPQYAEN